MQRRDFLLLKTRGRLRVADLSCERLYLRSIDARLDGSMADEPGWLEDGEPPAAFEPVSPTALFDRLRRDIEDADVVRLTGREWIGALEPEWRAGVEGIIRSVRDRGGRVEVDGSRDLGEASRRPSS